MHDGVWKRAGITLLLAACATTPSTAGAQTVLPDGPDLTAEPQVARWLAIAADYWGQRPACPDGVRIIRAAWSDEPNVWASATTPGCTVALHPTYFPMPTAWDRSWWARTQCNTMVHEYGHLLGFPHDPDPASIMYWDVPDVVPVA